MSGGVIRAKGLGPKIMVTEWTRYHWFTFFDSRHSSNSNFVLQHELINSTRADFFIIT